jgi:hypothetical protein
MPGLSAIAPRWLLAKGKYSLPIALGDPDAGAQHRGRL